MEDDALGMPHNWRDYYWRVWSALLLEFRGWSEAEVEAWAKFNNYLQGDDSVDGWISHDPMAAFLVRDILPDHLRFAFWGFAIVELHRDMQDALWPSSSEFVEPENADWPRIRREVARVITKWEARLRDGYEHKESQDGIFSGNVIIWETEDLPKLAD